MEDLLNQGLLLFGNAALAGLSLLFVWLAKLSAGKIKSEYWSRVTTKLFELSIRVVRSVFVAYVEPLKAAQGGKLTDEQKATAKQKGLDALKSYLGMKGIKEIGKVFATDKIEELLGDTLESALEDSRNASRTARGGANPPLPTP